MQEDNLNTSSSGQAPAQPAPPTGNSKARTVHSCNFRSAGRLSNEDARLLTAIHEDSFAHQLRIALDVLLGTSLDVKLITVDQLSLKEHLAGVSPIVVPLSPGTCAGSVILECDLDLVYPMLEVLMGGAGTPHHDYRELSEIDEEILREVIILIADQAEKAWKIPGLSLGVSDRIKPSMLSQFCPPNEKLTLMKFGIDLNGASGTFSILLSATFLGVLIKQAKLNQPQKKGNVWLFPSAPLRERILDCDMEVSAELPELSVSVRDLIALQPGTVLKLRAPIQTPGMLTAGGRAIFESVPVRNGTQRAAQLGRRALPGESNKGERKNG